MNARELLDVLDSSGYIEFSNAVLSREHYRQNLELLKSALRLLAAAEANDGTTPETDDEVRSSGSVMSMIGHARRLERERNAARKALAKCRDDADIVADTHYLLGMKAGWNAAQSEDEAAFFARVNARQAEISAARRTK